jgi:hypothetical protein
MMQWIAYKQATINYKAEKIFADINKYTFSKIINFALVGITYFSIKPYK